MRDLDPRRDGCRSPSRGSSRTDRPRPARSAATRKPLWFAFWDVVLWRIPGTPQKRHEREEIVAKLRQVDVLPSQGRPVAEAIHRISVTPLTCRRWRKECGGLKSDQLQRLQDLEKGNERRRKAGVGPDA